jgi:hypothetical protein
MASAIEPQLAPLAIPDVTPAHPTADDVIAAFRKHKLRPAVRSLLYLSLSAEINACALGALYYDEVGSTGLNNGDDRYSAIFRRFGKDWAIGVMCGFDQPRSTRYLILPGEITDQATFDEGVAVGRAVHRWAFEQSAQNV